MKYKLIIPRDLVTYKDGNVIFESPVCLQSNYEYENAMSKEEKDDIISDSIIEDLMEMVEVEL